MVQVKDDGCSGRGSLQCFCDNKAVVHTSTRPELTLKKKHQAFACHRTRKVQAAGSVRIAEEDD